MYNTIYKQKKQLVRLATALRAIFNDIEAEKFRNYIK